MIDGSNRLLQTGNRLTVFRWLLCAAFIGGISFSIQLWFPTSRSFPRAPVLFAPPEASMLAAEWSLSTILVVALILTMVSKRPALLSVLALVTLSVLVAFDQSRLQPWVYQYSLLLGVLALHDWRTNDVAVSDRTLSLLQLTVAAVYFWSGLQKLNFTFVHEIFPALLDPLLNALPWLPQPASGVGIFVALTEILIGCGLLYPRTRDLFVWLALTMHGVALALLIARGYNSVVWIWNCALMLVVTILFWRSDIYFWRPSRVRQDLKSKLAIAVTLSAALLPLLSFLVWWDMYLSGALYSGNTPVGVVKVDRKVGTQLPATAKAQLFSVETTGEEVLPLLEWSMADLNVPVYPETRVYKQITVDICKLATNKNEIELIVKERPTIFSGRYNVTRISCAHLEQ